MSSHDQWPDVISSPDEVLLATLTSVHYTAILILDNRSKNNQPINFKNDNPQEDTYIPVELSVSLLSFCILHTDERSPICFQVQLLSDFLPWLTLHWHHLWREYNQRIKSNQEEHSTNYFQ